MQFFRRSSVYITLFAATAVAAPAFAAQGGGAELGGLSLLLGSAYRSEDGFALGFELKAGVGLSPNVTGNIFYWRSTSGSNLQDGPTQISSSMALAAYGAEALYHVPGTYWSAGAKFGLMSESRNGSVSSSNVSINDSSSSIFIAPVLTYEVPVGAVSLGAEVSYFYPLSSSVSSALSTMALVRYRF